MSGGARPSRFGDAYFAFYTMAMRTGRPCARPSAIAELLRAAGFDRVRRRPHPRPVRHLGRSPRAAMTGYLVAMLSDLY